MILMLLVSGLSYGYTFIAAAGGLAWKQLFNLEIGHQGSRFLSTSIVHWARLGVIAFLIHILIELQVIKPFTTACVDVI